LIVVDNDVVDNDVVDSDEQQSAVNLKKWSKAKFL